MTTVASIAGAAFDAVAAKITDAIQVVTVTRTANGVYDTATGACATTETVQTGRAVLDTVKPVADVFPAHVQGAKDQLWLVEGVTSIAESDDLTINGTGYVVAAVQDIVGAGSLFYVLTQEVVE